MAHERKPRSRRHDETHATREREAQELERLREENERLRQQIEEQAKQITVSNGSSH